MLIVHLETQPLGHADFLDRTAVEKPIMVLQSEVKPMYSHEVQDS
jgi:hypothetical protein